MRYSFSFPLACAFAVTSLVNAQKTDPDLTGTWTTKSRKVLTGPGFYDPVNDKFFEPKIAGTSYSFTDDGHYEVALYKAISNPADPNCAQAIMQWQHGTYSKNETGWLILEPFEVDGRQLFSDPCQSATAVYTRYKQKELIKTYRVHIDGYNNVKRLDLFQYDGAPQNPMWLAYDPPQMLPTQTLNPTTGAPKSTGTSKSKRSLDGGTTSEQQLPYDIPRPIVIDRSMEDTIWWLIAITTVITSILYLKTR